MAIGAEVMQPPLDSTSALHIVVQPADKVDAWSGAWVASVPGQRLWGYGPTAIDALIKLRQLLQDVVWSEVFG